MNRKFVYILTALLFAGIAASPAAQAQFFYMENEDIGKPVKDFTLKVVGGEDMSLSQYRDGQKAIIFFWATWCPHCRVQLGELNKQQASIEAAGIKIAPVDVGESEAVAAKYLEKNGIKMNVFLDIDSAVSEEYGLIGVPTFYYVGADGVVIDVQHALPKDFKKVFEEKE